MALFLPEGHIPQGMSIFPVQRTGGLDDLVFSRKDTFFKVCQSFLSPVGGLDDLVFCLKEISLKLR